MIDRIKLIQDLLLEAVEIKDADKQSVFLTEACGSDIDLREELEELIQAEAAAGQSLPGEPFVSAPRASLRRAIEALSIPLPRLPLSSSKSRNARLAEADAKEKLRGAYLAQAQAGRWSRRADRRFEGLELLKKAAAIAPSLELRNEAIACMALSDVRTIKDVEAYPKDGNFCNFDCAYERYAFADANCTVHLRRVSDNSDLLMLPGYGPKVKTLQFSPDGRLLLVAWGQDDEHLEVVNLEDKEKVLRISEPYCRTAEFNSDSRLLAVTYEQPNHDFPVRIFDLILKTQIASFPHGSLVSCNAHNFG